MEDDHLIDDPKIQSILKTPTKLVTIRGRDGADTDFTFKSIKNNLNVGNVVGE